MRLVPPQVSLPPYPNPLPQCDWGRGRRCIACPRACERPAPSPPSLTGERVGVRGHGFLQRRPDRLNHLIRTRQRVVVPEAQHPQAKGFQVDGALRISRGFDLMLAAVELHYQEALRAVEVGDIASQPMLSPELDAELLVPDTRPQPCLRVGLLLAQALGEIGRHWDVCASDGAQGQ